MGMQNDSNNKGGISSLFRGHAGAATIAGTFEILFFHPFDTIAKRLMSSETSIMKGGMGQVPTNFNQVVFKKHANSSISQKFAYMYPGFIYAIWYKVLQRAYKFGGQPVVRDYINKNHGDQFKNTFGSSSKIMTDSVAGMLVGIGEVVLLPLDRLKVLSQTNEAALGGRSAVRVLLSEGRGMYAGTAVTMARNAPGSFGLFGGAAFAKDVIFRLEDYSKATFFQNTVASLVGSCVSITITNPQDVVKTRIQNKAFGDSVTGVSIVTEILKREGPGAFFKGLAPKVTASAPKLMFAYTMTEYFKKLLDGSVPANK